MSRSHVAVTAAALVAVTTFAGCGGTSAPVAVPDRKPSAVASSPTTAHASVPTPSPSALNHLKQVPAGWTNRAFGPALVATPSTWAPVELRNGKLVTKARLSPDERKDLLKELAGEGVLGYLIDTRTIRSFGPEYFVTDIHVWQEQLDRPFANGSELLRYVKDMYSGPDAPSEVTVTPLAGAGGSIVEARYTDSEGGRKAVLVELVVAFPHVLLHLDAATDVRRPGPHVAVIEAIARSASLA